ncbi:MAG: LLM class F420-dependent oxidoreductase [Dehalococcoidia bacterium]
MRVGVTFPQTEIGAAPEGVREYARAAEAAGYDHLLVYDHVLGANPDRPGGFRGPYNHETLFHEPMVLFGYLAGLTERLELVTGILILPQRQTALVAKQAAEVDVLSGGRLRLGVGVGWNAVEYEALGESFTNRGRRVEEQVALLRELWSKPVVSFEGRYHHIVKAGINPLPFRRHIPIWMGGMSEPVLERLGRLADGWFPQYREPGEIGVESRVSVGDEASVGPAVELAKRWEQAGATHLSVNTMNQGLTTPAQHVAAIERFRHAWDAVSR